MSYNSELQSNNAELQAILDEVNNLPEAGADEATVDAKIAEHNTANDSHQDIRLLIDGLQSGKLNATDLTSAINTALAQANASGEFDGANGKSAYELAQENGYKGSLTDFFADMKGADGKSAYAYAKDGGYTGTEEEFAQKLATDPQGRKKINKNVNFVGMSIWWHDGNTLSESGFGGGVICRGYQTLLKECFDILAIKNYCYSGFSLGAVSASDTSSIMLSKANEWTGSDGDIWTLDTITNDFKRDIPIGTISDYTNATGATTYYGALRAFADRITELSGNNAIVVCSNALRRDNSGYTSTSTNTSGHTLKDYEYALMNVAVRNNWYFVDQYRLSGITDDTIKLTTLDGLHLNNFGYTLAVKPWIEQFGILSARLLGEYGNAENPDMDNLDITGEITTGEYVSSNGTFTSATSSWMRTDFIKVTEGEDYAYYGMTTVTSTHAAFVYGYNEAKEPVMPIIALTKSAARVDSTETGMIFTIPAGVKYIACCTMATDKFAVKRLEASGFVDMAYPTVSYYLTSTGELTSTGSSWGTSARIFVNAEGVYKYYGNTSANNSVPCVCGYDASGAFVSVLLASGNYTSGKDFTVPSGVTYIRYCSVTSATIVGIYKSV